MNSAERHEARYRRRRERRAQKRLQAQAACGGLDRAVSLESLVAASRKCQCGVSWKASVQSFCLNRVLMCARLCRTIEGGSYKPGTAKRSCVHERGKTRSISAVPFRDRVVQRALCDRLMVPLVARTLIFDNGASLPNKGTDFSLDRLERHLRRHFVHHGMAGYIVLFDIHSYFASIDVDRLCALLGKAIPGTRERNLIELFLRTEKHGLGLGNQTSQAAAIFYLNSVDHWAQEQAEAESYGRYMDDGYALFATRGQARDFLCGLKRRCEDLGLALNPKKTRLICMDEPFVYLKVRFQLMPGGRVARTCDASKLGRERRRMRAHEKLAASSSTFSVADAAQSYSSWRSTVMHCDGGNAVLMRMDGFFRSIFCADWHDALHAVTA